MNEKMKTISVTDIAKKVCGYLENTAYYESVATYFHDLLCNDLREIVDCQEMDACLSEIRDLFQKILYCADDKGNISIKTIGHLYKEQIKDLRNSYAIWPTPPASIDPHTDKWKAHDQAMKKYDELQVYGETIPLEKVIKYKHLTVVK